MPCLYGTDTMGIAILFGGARNSPVDAFPMQGARVGLVEELKPLYKALLRGRGSFLDSSLPSGKLLKEMM